MYKPSFVNSVMLGCNQSCYQDGVTTHAVDQFKCQFKSSLVSTVFISPGGMQMLRPEGTLGMHGRLRFGVRVPAKRGLEVTGMCEASLHVYLQPNYGGFVLV